MKNLRQATIEWEQVIILCESINTPNAYLCQLNKFYHQALQVYVQLLCSCEVLHKWIPKVIELKRIPTAKEYLAYKRGLLIKSALLM